MKRSSWVYVLGLTLGVVFASSCGEEVIDRKVPETPFNPYDTIDFTSNMMPDPIIDSASFLGLHTYIFSKSCAVPACHDGTFEPDFRTVQSAYNTLVYHPVVKNTLTNDFEHRVIPNDPDNSWLYERLTTDDLTIGRMPLYDTLAPGMVALVKKWINNGAPDVWGNLPAQPDYLPRIVDVIAYLPNSGNMKIDTIRLNGNRLLPMIFPANTTVEMWFVLFDVNEDAEFPSQNYFIPPTAFTTNKIAFNANEPVDFSNAQVMNLTKEFTPVFHDSQFGNVPVWHHITINTANFTVGDVNYFRVIVNDGSHPTDTQLPDDGYPIYLQSFFSFIVQ